MVAWKKPVKEKTTSFNDFPELSLIFSTITIILAIAVLSLYFFGVKFYIADINYGKAIGLLGEERANLITKAVKLNPYSIQYRIALSKTYLYEAVQEAQKSQEDQNIQRTQAMVSLAIDEARKATEMQPNYVAAWENLGVVYREISGLAQGAIDWGINSFENALEYEPTNPVLYTEIGKLYIAKKDNEKAKEYFLKAKEEKSDYAEATIQLALLLESEEVIDQAILELEDLVTANPLATDGRFQLGRLYFNNNRVDEAIEQFKIVVLLIPNHSNAHYSLGIAYASQGETELAIQEFEKVLELNPGNQDVIQKIEEINGEKEIGD
jgi:Flp pilus assembly protein TadD